MGKFTDYLASAGSSIGTGLINFGLNQLSAKSQRDWQERMWNKQNDYNSPLSQSLRMRAAGLNPYEGVGSVPAGSAGTGAAAAPANVSDPLVLLNTFAQHDNIVAQTGRTITEEEKILRDISALDLAYQRGWIEYEDYKKRTEAKWKLYEELGETEDTASIKNTLAQARSANVQADDVEATRESRLSGMEDEHNLSVAQTSLINAQADYQKAVNDNLSAQQQAELKVKLSQASANYASAMASQAQAAYNNQLSQNASNDDARKAAQHAIELQILKYAESVGASEAQIAKLKAYTESLWAGKKYDYSWSDAGNMLLNFVHENLNLSGGAGYKFGN